MNRKRKYKQYFEASSSSKDSKIARQTLWRWKKKIGTENFGPSSPLSNNPFHNNAETSSDRSSDSDTINNNENEDFSDVNICEEQINVSYQESASESSEAEINVNPRNAINGDNIDINVDKIPNTFLFEKPKLTKEDVQTMVLALGLRHNLSNEAKKHVLQLIKVCADVNANDNSFSTTKYMMAKEFDPPQGVLKYVFFCEKCHRKLLGPINTNEFQPVQLKCDNSECNFEQKLTTTDHNFFMTIDVKDQVQSILQDKNIFDNLHCWKDQTKTDNIIIRDVYDGSIYRKLKKTQTFDLSYNFSTDGAPIFHSSKLSMWPIQFIINEIPPQYRFKRLVLAGIWVGKGEPRATFMNTFLEEFLEQSNLLLQLGIEITNTNGSKKNFKLLPLFCSVDSVARPIIQNRSQFNGYYGCSWCYHPGTITNKQIKYPKSEYTHQLRSNTTHLNDVKEAAIGNYKTKIRGVKGPSILLTIPTFDIVWALPPDYMHGVILGVVRQLWEIWTTYDHTKKLAYYIGRTDIISKINKRLHQIKPPQEIQRTPRPLNERAKWKATEWKCWLLFYALPCLQGILNVKFLEHFALLVNSIYILLQNEISTENLKRAEIYLNNFVNKMEVLYGPSCMTFNVHSLLHLTESVRKTGPLWATSTFPFESGIYRIKQQITGPAGVIKQIAKKMYQSNTIFLNLNSENTISDKCRDYCFSLYSAPLNNLTERKVTSLGHKSLLTQAQRLHYFSLNQEIGDEPCFVTRRCIYNKLLIHTEEYTKSLKTCDSVVELKNGDFIKVLQILLTKNSFIYGEKLITSMLKFGNTEVTNIYEVFLNNITSTYCVVPVNDIKEKCVFIEIDLLKYVCRIPNTYEVQ